MSRIINLLVIASLLNLASCAAMFSGTRDNISIRSNEEGSTIYMNEMYLGKNNAFTTIPKKGAYSIRVSKKGCADKTVPITRSFDPITLLGALIDWGLVSILIVDGVATGAIHKADQTTFVIDPEC
jgi:hypothetical protein